jgi:hypothetical protein
VFVDTPLDICEAARREGPVREGPRRADSELHRHRFALRSDPSTRNWCSTPSAESTEQLAIRVVEAALG